MKKETQKKATSKKPAAKKSKTSDKPLWVWKLSWEDINELETSVSLYRTEAKAKAAMEEDIRRLRCWEEDAKIEREDALHATLGRFRWAITKAEVH